MIGHALAQARGLVTKHAVKQVDRLLSNDGIDVWDSFTHWVPHQIGARQRILVAMDWTEFDQDDQATLVLSSSLAVSSAVRRRKTSAQPNAAEEAWGFRRFVRVHAKSDNRPATGSGLPPPLPRGSV